MPHTSSNSTNSANDDVIATLLQGAQTFRQREYGASNSLMRSLSGGQQPGAIMIACADSRVDPALVFGVRPGDLLVVRVVANLVPPPDSAGADAAVMAAVELGLNALGIPHLIVCGHSRCAGVRTALDQALGGSQPGEPAPGAAEASHESCLERWTAVADIACQEIIAAHGASPLDELCRHAEQRSVLQSLENLRARPWLREREARGELTLHGWGVDIVEGTLWVADPESAAFAPVC